MSVEKNHIETFMVMLSDQEHHNFMLPCKAFRDSTFFNSRLGGRWRTSESASEEVIHTFHLNAPNNEDAVLLEYQVRFKLFLLDS